MNQKEICLLAIESSCDETSASVCVAGKILSNKIATQKIHEQYGGVVPELASRVHMQNIIPVVDIALKEANISLQDLAAIAFTKAPGLIGSLLVGAQFAKSLALALEVPLIGVHHMQAHVLANLINDSPPQFPFLCLTVSGGHTQIVVAHAPLRLEVIGETMDDAAGEAFDKTAKLVGLPYPGGPMIDKYAANGDAHAFKFAEPQVPDLNFSFSGVKTSVLYFLQKKQKENPDFISENINDLCASIQYTIVNILLKKIQKAVTDTGISTVCLAGGVSANSALRSGLQRIGNQMNWQTYVPELQYCLDNAGMIAITAYYKYLSGQFETLGANVSARAEW